MIRATVSQIAAESVRIVESIVRVLIERWIGRGVLRPETDSDLLVEAILAPIYLRVLLPGGPLTGDVLEGFIDLALDGVLEDVASGRSITDEASAAASDAAGVDQTERANTT